MITKRIIPCLDVKNGRVVKGVNFEGLNDVSSPVSLGKFYSDCGADELVFYDITLPPRDVPFSPIFSVKWPPPSSSPSPLAAASTLWTISTVSSSAARTR